MSPAPASPTPSLGLFRLTWPLFLEFLLFLLMGTADTLMLSGVSDAAVAAVGVANQCLFICILVMEMVSHGAALVVSQYVGAGRRQEAAKIAALSISLNLALGFVVSAALFWGGEQVLLALNLQGEVRSLATGYLRVVGGCLFFQALLNIFSSLLRTYGFTRESMFLSLGMNLLHVGGNFALIYGHFGFPAWGVKGAALSTVISRAVAMLAFFWALNRVMGARMAPRDYVRLSGEYLRKIFTMGVPSALESLTYQCCQMVFLYYATYLGTAALAARQYALSVSQYIYLFSLAIGMGTSILVGRLVGAGRPEDAFRRVLTSLKWSLCLTLVVDGIAILLRQPLLRLFTQNEEVLRVASQVLLLSLFLESGRSFNLVLVNALRATGDALFTVYLGVLSMVCMSLPLGYFLALKLGWGLAGVWVAIAVDEWTRGLTFWVRWRSRVWEKKILVSPVEPALPAAGSPEALPLAS